MTNSFVDNIDRLTEKLYRFIYRITGNHEDSLDMVQETFIKTFQTWKRDGIRLRDGYFYKTAYTLALNEKRNRQLHTEKENIISDQQTSLTGEDPVDTFEKTETSKQVIHALNKLSEKQKEVVMYRFFLDFTIVEIASTLSISDGSVKVHLARGLQKLKKILVNKERIGK